MAALKEGDVIAGRYELLEQLGRGGMGVVYYALDRQTGGKVALKTLLPQYSRNVRAVERFMREVNAARALNHPGIVRILDAHHEDDLLFYTMEFVEGQSLRSMMRKRNRFGMGSTMRILTLLCNALEHAHKHTIHRDVSPENVMVTPDGNVKLLDFGLAKLTNDDASFTRVGISLGKIQYIAPEQRSDAKNVDHRADLYSLGVMFYEMLTGELPMYGKPLTDLRPDLPKACDDFAARALAATPDGRFNSAGEFREALARVYELSRQAQRKTPMPVDMPPPPVAAPQPAWWRRILARFLPKRGGEKASNSGWR